MTEVLNSGFSRNLMGKLNATYNNSQLLHVGGRFDGEPLKARHFQDVVMPSNPLGENPDLVVAGRFNVLLPKIAGSMLYADTPGKAKRNYIAGIGGEDYANAMSIAVDLADPDSRKKHAIRLVFGATAEMPLRGLSYMMPALSFLEDMPDPARDRLQLQVIFAHNLSGHLNGLDSDVVKQQSRSLARVASTFTGEFYPNVSGNVVFMEDTPVKGNTVVQQRMAEIEHLVRENASQDILDRLQEKNTQNGGIHEDHFYGAAHLLIHDQASLDILQPLFPGQPDIVNPTSIISFGGMQERIFARLRHQVKPHASSEFNEVLTGQYYSKHFVPPYYMARGGDRSLDAVLNGETQSPVVKAAQCDLEYLQTVASQRADFGQFLERQKVT